MTHAQFVRSINVRGQQKTILAHLMTGEDISNIESLIVYGISRLSSVVNRLRAKGFDIKTDVRKDAQGHKYSRYSLA